jgi:hypothetical protein
MSELTLQLPETLYQQLESLAANEGVPLHHYIVYTLTREASLANTIHVSSPEAIALQRANFEALLHRLGKASETQIDDVLATREVVTPEPDLRPETIEKLKRLIARQQAATD